MTGGNRTWLGHGEIKHNLVQCFNLPSDFVKIDVENGHRNSEFPHKKIVIFNSYAKLPEGNQFINLFINKQMELLNGATTIYYVRHEKNISLKWSLDFKDVLLFQKKTNCSTSPLLRSFFLPLSSLSWPVGLTVQGKAAPTFAGKLRGGSSLRAIFGGAQDGGAMFFGGAKEINGNS